MKLLFSVLINHGYPYRFYSDGTCKWGSHVLNGDTVTDTYTCDWRWNSEHSRMEFRKNEINRSWEESYRQEFSQEYVKYLNTLVLEL